MNETDRSLIAEGVTLSYRDGDRVTHALQNVDLRLDPGRVYGIMGPSGSGKSSLLYLLSGLKRPTSGRVRFDGADLARLPDAARAHLRRTRFGFVFQQPFLLPWLTAMENALTGARDERSPDRSRANALFAELGIEGLGSKYPGQLSGGERQRVAVVRAMMNEPQILFADEPTAALDHENGQRVVDALARWRAHGTVVIVTHDPEMVRDADTVIRLRDGRRVDPEPGVARAPAP